MQTAPSNRAVRLGVVGCGHVAELVHLPVLARLPEFEVVALADSDPHRLALLGAHHPSAPRYSDAGGLLADPRVEAVGVLVPPADHAEIAVAALDAGKHVLVEKPLTLSLDDADRMVRSAEVARTAAMVGFNLRRLDLVERARKAVADGAVGTVHTFRSALTSRRRYDDQPEWRVRRKLGGGSLVEQGVHHFDLWRFLLGSEVESVFAVAHDGDSGAAVTARMTNGTLVQTTLSERTTPLNSVEILGTEGSLRLRLSHFDGFELLPLHRDESSPGARARALMTTVRGLPRGVAELRRGGRFASSYAEQWRHFGRAVRGTSDGSPDFKDGRRAMEIVMAATESASSGEVVPVGAAPRVLALNRDAE